MANVILRVKREDGSWAEIPALVGPVGPQGVSINDIVLKSQEGGVSTYLILLSDGSEKTFQVTDGAIITDVSLISTDVLIDTYKISISDGSFFNFKVTNGRGIKSIAKTSTDVLSDTYTISYNDNTSSTFKVTNGRSITKIVKSNTDVLTDTYTISYNDNTTSTYTITNGRGIDYIEKDETIGLSDRYTIHYNDGSTSYYHVVNGEAGPAGSIGNRIYLSGLVDKVNDEEGYGRVKELKESKFDLSKFTVVGSPVISEDGVASGFSRSNYIKCQVQYPTKPFNIRFKFKCPTNNAVVCQFGSAYARNTFLKTSDHGFNWWIWNNNSEEFNMYVQVNSFVINGEYEIYAGWDGQVYFLKIYKDGTLLNSTTQSSSVQPLLSSDNSFYIANGNGFREFTDGSIDLKQFSITVDGKEVFSGNPTALDTIKANNYTITGSPTITNDGIFKANATGDYLVKSGFTNEIKKELRCDGRFYYSTKTSNTGNVINLANGSVISWNINSDGLITLVDGTSTSTVQIEIPLKDGDIFDTEIIYNASTITLNVCLNEGVNYTTSIASQGLTTFKTWILSTSENYWGGTIDLNTIHVYIDGNLVYQPCLKIPYTKAKTGSKIVDAAYRLRVEDCYNQYGVGNYYLFSSATEQFALPMPDIYGLIENLDTKIINLDNKISSKLTNCILEIPQRIKLELNNGTLTLKAGSQVIVPNGFEDDGTTRKFDEVVIKNDISQTVTSAWATGKHIICYNITDNALLCRIAHASGTSPSGDYTVYYNTATNVVRNTNITDKEISLPIGFATVGNLAFTSIDQVFNGMGYIGSTIWVDKGVKGLIPNGRNADGSLNNIEFTTEKVLTRTFTGTTPFVLGVNKNSIIIDNVYFYSQESKPSDVNYIWYKPSENILTNHNGDVLRGCVCIYANRKDGVITMFNPKQPFRAVDYSEYRTEIDKCVKKSGDTMTGNLNISRNETALYKVTNSAITLGSTPSSRVNIGGMWYIDGANHLAGIIQCYVGTTGETGFQFITRKPDNSAWGAFLDLHTNTDGTSYFDFPKCTTKATTTSSASSNKVAVVVQNYVNGTSWYRVWSDGWIEQGGYTQGGKPSSTITFLKSFTNTNFTITLATSGVLGTNNNGICSVEARTTSTIKLYSYSSYYCNWYACGY